MSESISSMREPAETTPALRNGAMVFALTGAAGSAGGIASANLNVLQALCRLSRQHGRPLVVLSLHEKTEDRPDFLDEEVAFTGFSGNRLAYAFKLLALFHRRTFYLFDHVRLALPLIPVVLLGFHSFVILAHGSEAWRRVRGSSKWLFRRARMCLTNSEFTLDKMHETFAGFEGQSCILGLPPIQGGDSDMARRTGALTLPTVNGGSVPLGDRVILLVGRMDRGEREKGHYELLRIWPSVLREFPDAQLVFAGPGNDRSALVERTRDLGVAPTVFIPGFLPAKELRDLYAKCYAFAMPSRQEGFGLVFLEAMNAGKACIACRGGGGEEIVEHEVSGLLLDNPYRDDDLLSAVKRLLTDEDLALRFGSAGKHRLGERFTSECAQRRLVEAVSPML